MEHKPRILLVDDEPGIRQYLELVLKREGFPVDTASDAAEALDIISRHEPAVVLCDIRMPGELDGIGLLQRVRESPLSTEFIMMSAYGSRETALKAVEFGAYDYIDKPIQRDDLLLTLYKFLERERLRTENNRLRAALTGNEQHGELIAHSAAMTTLLEMARKVATYPTPVLLSGESGTGKEMLARAIHRWSERNQAPFVAINCGAIPTNLLESELFGYRKGAFTGAQRDHTGLIEAADGGVLFLDEIGEMPLMLQVKLLRVLQEQSIRRLGENHERPVHVRILAASNRDLQQEIQAGRFRQDLYFRLNVLHLVLPPLRERPEDIPFLARHFLQRLSHSLGKQIQGIQPATMKALQGYVWPGNIRELKNVVERAILLEDNSALTPSSLPEALQINEQEELPPTTRPSAPDTPDENQPAHSENGLSLQFDSLSIKDAVRHIEIVMIQKALEQTGGNRTAASRLLEISQRALLYKIKQYDLS